MARGRRPSPCALGARGGARRLEAARGRRPGRRAGPAAPGEGARAGRRPAARGAPRRWEPVPARGQPASRRGPRAPRAAEGLCPRRGRGAAAPRGPRRAARAAGPGCRARAARPRGAAPQPGGRDPAELGPKSPQRSRPGIGISLKKVPYFPPWSFIQVSEL